MYIAPGRARSSALALFQERVRAILLDAGQSIDGLSDPPAYEFASQVDDYVRLEFMVETGFASVVERGANEKTLALLLTTISTKARLAQQLGMERRSKPVATLADILATHEDAPSEAPAAPRDRAQQVGAVRPARACR